MAMTRLQEELEAIREANGGLLRAIDVVAFAEAHPDSALHSQFTWDDAVAGVQYRFQEARNIIRMTVFVRPNSTQEIRTYVSLESDRQFPGGGYRHLSEVMNESDRRDMLLRQALRELVRFREKYEGLKDLASVFGSLDEILALQAVNQDTLDLMVDQAPEPSS